MQLLKKRDVTFENGAVYRYSPGVRELLPKIAQEKAENKTCPIWGRELPQKQKQKIVQFCEEYVEHNGANDLLCKITTTQNVSDTDVRRELRKQQMLCAAEDIKQYTVFGLYAGTLYLESEVTHSLHHGQSLYLEDYEKYITGVKTKMNGKEVVVDALQYGNATRYINDPRTNPYHDDVIKCNDGVERANVEIY